MPGFDQGPQLLGVASEAIARKNQNEEQNKALNQDAIQKAGAPIQAAATQGLTNMADQATNKITITPEMSEGLSKLTGDEGWKRSSGTKWDPRIFTAMVGLQSKKAYHDELVEAGLIKETKRDDSKEKIAEGHDKTSEAVANIHAGATVKSAEIKGEATKKAASIRKDTKSSSQMPAEDKEFLKTYRGYGNDLKGMNSMLLQQMAKTDPSKAKELQDKQTFLQKNQDRFNKLQGTQESDGSDDPAVTDFIKKNGIKDTPDNRAWAKTKVNG